MNVLMVGVDKHRIGGMWTVAETYINDRTYNQAVNLRYIATSTCGSKYKRTLIMLGGYVRIFLALLVGKVDIVHVHMAERGSTFRKGIVVHICKLFNIPVVIQLHAGPFMDWYLGISIRKQNFIKKIFKKSDRILVLGVYWEKQLEKLVDANKLEVLYNGSDCPMENMYNVDGQNILYLGLLKKTKGIYDLLNAIEYVNDKLEKDIVLYLCGKDEEGDLAQIISDKHLDDRIQMLGWISKEKRLELFKNTVICILPSYFEALSMTVIESMCYGIPIITTSISTMPELIGDVIPLVEPGDYKGIGNLLVELLSDKKLRVRCSEGLYNRAVAKFSVKQNIDHTLMIYHDCIQKKHSQKEDCYRL